MSKRKLLYKNLKTAAIIIVSALTVLVTGGSLFFSGRQASPPAANRVDLKDYVRVFPEVGYEHIPEGTKYTNYNSNPPTSGAHYERPAEWGIYDHELPDEEIVHNLEHCGIWISYQSSLPAAEKDAIKSFAAGFPTKIIVTVRDKNSSPIAFAAWQHLMELQTFSKDLANAFVGAYLNKAGRECNAN